MLKTKQNTMIGVYLKGHSSQLKEYSVVKGETI